MKRLNLFILSFVSLVAFADVKISQLPLKSAATTNANDSFPFVNSIANETDRMALGDLPNLPSLQSTYISLATTRPANRVLAGPATGSDAAPSFRALVSADVPVIPLSTGTTGTLSVARGGTGITSGTSGGVLGFTASGTLASSAALSQNQVVIGGGPGFTPTSLAAGTQGQALRMGASFPTFGALDLSLSGTSVTNALGATNGGTAQTAWTIGDLLYASTTNTLARLSGNITTTRKFLAQTGTGSVSAAPAWTAPTPPTVQVFTSGSGTYTRPAAAIYLKVRMIGGGGGGASSGTTTTSVAGSNGADTTFSTITAGHGNGGPAYSTQAPGTGGSCTGGDVNISGGNGGPPRQGGVALSGGYGGQGAFGGGAPGGENNGGGAQSGTANTGGGGGTPGATASNNIGSGGGAGGYCEKIITSPATTYSYGVATGGAGGTAGSGGAAGGTGGSGIVIVEEFYQ